MPRGNRKNITPLTERPPDEARAIRSAGGRASSKAQIRKRTFREAVTAMLNQPLPPELEAADVRMLIDKGGDPSVLDAVVASLLRRAIDGDKQAVDACKLILAQLGEDTPDKTEIVVRMEGDVNAEIMR